MTKIYTKQGDKGYTSLVGGIKVKKSELSVEAYGTVDEVNSILGIIIAKLSKEQSNPLLDEIEQSMIQVQQTLFHVGAELSTPSNEKVYWPIKEQDIAQLEEMIDQIEVILPPLKQFILPGGSEIGALIHFARTVVRRAERIASSILEVNPLVLAYLNRLSDYLFVAARYVNIQLGIPETPFVSKA